MSFIRLKVDISFESEQQIINISVNGLNCDICQELKRLSNHCTSLIFNYRLALFFELCQSGYYEKILEEQNEELVDVASQDRSRSTGPTLQWLDIIMKASTPYYYKHKPLQVHSAYLFWWFGQYQFSEEFTATTLRTRLFSRGMEFNVWNWACWALVLDLMYYV